MCQIVVFDHEAPTTREEIKSIVEDSQMCNGHGSGVAWVEHKRAVWIKGVDLDAEYLTNLIMSAPRPVVLHTRIKTAGDKIDLLCHPFPVSVPNRSRGSDPMGLMFHNGIFTPWRKFAALTGLTINERTWSDTKVMSHLAARFGWTALIRAVKEDGGDKLAIFHPKWKKQPLQLVGKFERSRGVLVSSPFWEFRAPSKGAGAYYDWHGWDDEGLTSRGWTKVGEEWVRIDENERVQTLGQRPQARQTPAYEGKICTFCRTCNEFHPKDLCPQALQEGCY